MNFEKLLSVNELIQILLINITIIQMSWYNIYQIIYQCNNFDKVKICIKIKIKDIVVCAYALNVGVDRLVCGHVKIRMCSSAVLWSVGSMGLWPCANQVVLMCSAVACGQTVQCRVHCALCSQQCCGLCNQGHSIVLSRYQLSRLKKYILKYLFFPF